MELPLKVLPEYREAKIKFYYCDCGYEHRATVVGIYNEWALQFFCPACKRKWYGCCVCQTARTKLYTRRQITSHNNKQHLRQEIQDYPCNRKRAKVDSTTTIYPQDSCETHNGSAAANSTGHHEYESPCYEPEPFNDFCDDNDNQEVIFHVQNSNELMVVHHISPEVTWLDLGETTNFGMNDKANMKYFGTAFHPPHTVCKTNETSPGAGEHYLVKQSQICRELNITDSKDIDTPGNQIRLQMLIAKLAFNLGSTKRELLAKVLSGVYEVGCEDGYCCASDLINKEFNNKHDETKFDLDYIANNFIPVFSMSGVTRSAHKFGTKFPSTVTDIRKYYTEYKYAIVPNLPHPRIRTDVRDHSYISVVDCVRDFFAHHNAPIATIISNLQATVPVVRHPTESKRAYEVLQNACQAFGGDTKGKVVSYLTLWKDDCDPGATIMQGKACVHVITFTIATLLEDGNRIQNTYPISIGRKGVSHDEVERKISEELQQLQDVKNSSPFYVASTNKHMEAYFEVLATLADQPERRASNYLGHGNGTYTARWSVSANHYALYHCLPSCTNCQNILMQRFNEGQWSLPVPQCPLCLNWDVLQDSPLALTPLPGDYPALKNGDTFINIPEQRIVEVQPDMLRLRPFRLTYNQLKTAIDLAHDGFMTKNWTSKNVSAFLKVEGLHDEAIADFLGNAERQKSLELAIGSDLELLLKDRDLQPSLYQKWKLPALWDRSGCTLIHHVDCIMHLLFLGVVKTVHFLILLALRVRSREASFVRQNRQNLFPLVRLNLDWFKVGEYTGGKFQAWNAEHNLAFGRIMPWFLQNFDEALKEVPPGSIPPNKFPQKQWTKLQNGYWLKLRGIPDQGSAKDLCDRVAAAMMEDPVPEIVDIPDVTPSEVQELILILSVVLECVMSRQVTTDLVAKTSYAIRIFMSTFDAIDSKLRGRKNKKKNKKKQPTVIQSYNFACLLNLPEAMSLFGPLRELWEGSYRGEGFLRVIKERYRGMQTNWHYNLLQNILRDRAFDNILSPGPCSMVDNAINDLRNISGMFYKYSSLVEVAAIMDELQRSRKSGLSVVILSDDPSARIFAVVGDHDTVVEIEFIGAGEDVRVKFGQTYHQFGIKNDITGDVLFLDWKGDVLPGLTDPKLGYGILLPLLDKENNESGQKFALVSSNWKWLTSRDTLSSLVD